MPRNVLAKWHRIRFPTTSTEKLIPKMPYVIPDEPIKVRGGPHLEHMRRLYPWQMRLKEIAKSVNQLIDEERIELSYYRAYEVRNYTERLIGEAIRYGDCHRPTMELADFYLQDKKLIHKLFKVLVPRYLNYTTSFTSMHLLSNRDWNWEEKKKIRSVQQRAMLELKGNPYPPVFPDDQKRKDLLHNILLAEASREYYLNKKEEENKKE